MKNMAKTRRVKLESADERNNVIYMAVQTRRRGEAKKKIALLAKVDHSVKKKVERIAATLGISQAAAVEMMLKSVEVDASGRPAFWTGPLPTDVNEELPIARSA